MLNILEPVSLHPRTRASAFNSCVQVVEIKLQVELEERRKKALHLQKASRKGMAPGEAFPLSDRVLPQSCAHRHREQGGIPGGCLLRPRKLVVPGDPLARGAAAWAACSRACDVCWLSQSLG